MTGLTEGTLYYVRASAITLTSASSGGDIASDGGSAKTSELQNSGIIQIFRILSMMLTGQLWMHCRAPDIAGILIMQHIKIHTVQYIHGSQLGGKYVRCLKNP
jgi:hypothetical protein